MSDYHRPVLSDEIIEAFQPVRGKRIIDATVGGGGHAQGLLLLGAKILGIDEDPEAIAHATDVLKRTGRNGWTLVRGNFKSISEIAGQAGFEKADGVLFDLGISSHQIDTQDRGFSYMKPDAPLDARFNQNTGTSASDIVNHASREELYEIFSAFGEEKHAGAIAGAIVGARSVEEIRTAGQLTSLIDRSIRDGLRTGAYGRIFQALRIAVNGELASLKNGLTGACERLVPGGRLAVISYHSLEDRIVKLFLRGREDMRELTRKPILPSDDEMRQNSRSRSAKLRTGEKVL